MARVRDRPVGVGLPAAAGTLLGGLYATRNARCGWSWIRRWLTVEREARVLQFTLGRDPAPRAWDDFFSERPTTYLRVRTVDGAWLGGLFAADSYAGDFPNDADLLLEEAWRIDEDGTFAGGPLGYAVYIPAGTISFVELVPQEEAIGDHV